MSVLRPLLSRRGRVVLVAASLLLIATLVAAPSVGGAKPASVKQFIASLSAAGTGSFTVTVTNCGGPVPLPDDCTASSTIALGAVQIAIPTGLQEPAPSVSAITPSGTIWNASYNPATKTADILSPGGSNKLNPGQSLLVTINVATTCDGTKEFTTKAWGSNSISGTDPFEIKSSQPTLTCAVSGTQTETITGDFQGTINVTFGGETGPDCSSEAGFGDLGAQWEVYRLPTQVTITPGSDFVAGDEPKIATSEFPLPSGGGDSSWFLICFAVPQAGHTAFETRGGGTAVSQPIGGIPHFVGILASCVDAPTPCVSEQFLTTGPGAPPWSTGANKVHIAVRMDPGDPYKR